MHRAGGAGALNVVDRLELGGDLWSRPQTARQAIVPARAQEGGWDAAVTALQRLALFGAGAADPAAALELKDALRMGVFACVGAGDLAGAARLAAQNRSLPVLREHRDLAVEDTLLPNVLARRWQLVRGDAELFLADWTADGRPPAAGRAIGPCAVARMYGLLDEDGARATWLAIVAELRGDDPGASTRGSDYRSLFDAIVLLHRGRRHEALQLLSIPAPRGWYGGLLVHWHAAALAEAIGHNDLSVPPPIIDHTRALIRGQ